MQVESTVRVTRPKPRVLGGVALLVVDDDLDFLDYVRGVLENFGARVGTACDGVEALEVLAAAVDAGGGFDAVLTDLRMPLPDGVQLAATIRTAGYQVPILIVTAFAGPEVDRAAARFEGVRVLSKPFDPLDLVAAVARLIASRPLRP